MHVSRVVDFFVLSDYHLSMSYEPESRLSRRLTTKDAVIIGMSSMIGSGIFVAIGPAAASAGSGILFGILIAAGVAFCNATSSAQLAAVYPESGGTYVYGRKQLGLFWGWLSGWVFIVGKTASCAAAALTFGHYVYPGAARILALGAVIGLAALNYFGIQKTANMSQAIVIFVLAALAVITAAALFGGTADATHLRAPLAEGGLPGILQSGALMFFAFAGYARIATLGEEVRDPRRSIPQAIVWALFITTLIYLIVVTSALLAIGPAVISGASAPLADAVKAGRFSALTPVARAGAAAGTLGVLLSLMVGISRTAFSMAANREFPHWLAAVHPAFKIPHHAEIIVALVVGLIVLSADVRSAVGFSAFTILLYYAVTNASAIKLADEQRLWPQPLAVAGLLSCLLLAFSLPVESLFTGGGVTAAGIFIYFIRVRFAK